MRNKFPHQVIVWINDVLELIRELTVFCGPCWDRTNDPLIMSQVL